MRAPQVARLWFKLVVVLCPSVLFRDLPVAPIRGACGQLLGDPVVAIWGPCGCHLGTQWLPFKGPVGEPLDADHGL